ncbi:MAG TPA: NADH-quinone oxidoreductase subunit A [Thermodesulfovibrionia bacterium]|nr:NADH-quinone oxidoreductase subunit A [Thermodesulfovibrionia bacterium]
MPGTYLPSAYLPVLIFLCIAALFGLGSLLIGYVLRPQRKYSIKLMPYESGNDPIGEPRNRFFIRYYIIAILFIVFDVETVFLYPWAVAFDKLGLFGAVEMIIFILILAIGYVYAWKKNALRWD